jgi:hypothetical protein
MSQGNPFVIHVSEHDDTPEGQRQGTLSLAAQLHDALTAMGGSIGMDKDAFLQQLQTEMEERDNAPGNDNPQ